MSNYIKRHLQRRQSRIQRHAVICCVEATVYYKCLLCSIYTAGREKRHLHAFLETPVLSTTQRVPGSVKSTCREVEISERDG